MEQEEVVYLKVFDEKNGDVVFEGKVSTDVEPHELVYWRSFLHRNLTIFFKKETNEKVTSLKGLQNNVELVVSGDYKDFSGVLYVGADDKVLRTSKGVPSCECVKVTVMGLSHEECEKVFKWEMLEELQIVWCGLRQIPTEIGKMKKLKKLRLEGFEKSKSLPEEIGELSNLEELRIGWSGFESLPKRLKELKMLKSISLESVFHLLLNAEDLVVFSKLKHLTSKSCDNAFSPSFSRSFWEMVKSSTDLSSLYLHWHEQDQEMLFATFEENGSIIDGGEYAESYAHFFERNKENHERAMECVIYLLAIRRRRNALNNVPKEMVKMLAMMLWMMRCDVSVWSKK